MAEQRVNDTTMFVPAARPTRTSWAGEIMALLLLALSPVLVIGVFLGDLHDRDSEYLKTNPVVLAQAAGEGVRQAFSLSAAETNVPHGWYAPLEHLTSGLQYRLHGTLAWPFRLVNLLLHVATAWFLFRIIQSLLPRGAVLSAAEEPVNADAVFNTGRQVVAAFGALFFFLHPVNVESVTWISQRGCVQAAFFGVLSWWLITRQGPERGSWRCLATPSWACYGFSLFCLVLAILSHPMACGFAGVLALTQCVWIRGNPSSRWLRPIGYVAVGVLSAGLSAEAGAWASESGTAVPLTALAVLGRTIVGILVPTQLGMSYVLVPPTGVEDVNLWVAVALVLLVIVIPAWLPVGMRPTTVLVVGFFLVLLPWVIPGSGVDAPGNQGLCLALPIVGAMVGLGIEALQYRLRFMGRESGKIGETVGVGLVVLLLLALGFLSVARSFAFGNRGTILREVLSGQPADGMEAAEQENQGTDAGTPAAP